MTVQQYIDQIKVNKQPFVDIYEALQVPESAKSLFDGLPGPVNLAVFTADWCGDAVSTTPVILRLAESSPNISVQVFNRDDELELTNSFLPENRAGTVPVFVVMDSNMGEIARFVETALELVPSIDAMDDAIAEEVARRERGEPQGRQPGQAHGVPGVPCPGMGRGDLGRVRQDGDRRAGYGLVGQAGGGRHQMAAGRLGGRGFQHA